MTNFEEWFKNHREEPVLIKDHSGAFYMCSCMKVSAHHDITNCPVCGIKWDWNVACDLI